MIELSENVLQDQVAHLDENVFHEALEYALRECEEISLEKVKITLGSKIGDNYLGLIFRAEVEYRLLCTDEEESNCLNMIIKCVPIMEANEFLQVLNVFLKEKIMYQDILSHMETISQGALKFGASLYHSLKFPITTLFLEDLTTHNYNLASRQAGLDEVHSLMVLKKLAKFHALSILLQNQEPDVMNCFKHALISKPVMTEDSTPLQFFNNMLRALITVASSWPSYESIVEKLQKYQLNLRHNLLRSVEPRENELQVLNHGDLWTNNVLFKYALDGSDSSSDPVDAVFVDFQMSAWGSPGIDLNNFFNTSVRLDVLQHERTRLLQAYHESLVDTLEQHNWDQLPSFEDVQQAVQDREEYGFTYAFGIFPMISMEPNDSSDNSVDNLVDDEFMANKTLVMFESPRVQETLKYSLKRFDDLGVFD